MNNNKDSVEQLIFIVSVASLCVSIVCTVAVAVTIFFCTQAHIRFFVVVVVLNKSHRRKTFTHLWALFVLMVY